MLNDHSNWPSHLFELFPQNFINPRIKVNPKLVLLLLASMYQILNTGWPISHFTFQKLNNFFLNESI